MAKQEEDLDLGEDAEAPAAPPPRSKMKLILIGVIALVLIGGIGATVMLLLSAKSDEPAVAEATAQGAEDGAKAEKGTEAVPAQTAAPLSYLSLDPAFVVNFSGDYDGRFLQVSLEVSTRDPAVLELIKEHRPAIRNNLVLLFSSQSPESLSTREGKEALRAKLLEEIRRVLKQEAGNDNVEQVYYTAFVMQ